MIKRKAEGKRVAIYARVSTNGQTVENQVRDLREVARHQGWKIVATFKDAGYQRRQRAVTSARPSIAC